MKNNLWFIIAIFLLGEGCEGESYKSRHETAEHHEGDGLGVSKDRGIPQKSLDEVTDKKPLGQKMGDTINNNVDIGSPTACDLQKIQLTALQPISGRKFCESPKDGQLENDLRSLGAVCRDDRLLHAASAVEILVFQPSCRGSGPNSGPDMPPVFENFSEDDERANADVGKLLAAGCFFYIMPPEWCP
jgi:hypothetical protein